MAGQQIHCHGDFLALYIYTLWLFKTQNCILLGYYTASSGNFLPMFQDNLLVPSSRDKNPKFLSLEA